MSATLRVRGLEVALGDRPILHRLDLDVHVGEFVALVGPNGSGKTTLLRTIYGALTPQAGSIMVDGTDAAGLTSRQRARLIAAMTQNDEVPIGLVVRDVVTLGRVPHLGRMQRTSRDDRQAIDEGMHAAAVAHLADRPFARLSGGERQRVHLARALAQQTPILVLDEPTNHLDVAGQLELLDAVRALDVTVIMSLHDLNLAAAYADTVVVMTAGRLVAVGDALDVLTPELIASVYGVHAVCGRHPLHGRLQLSFAPIARPSTHEQAPTISPPPTTHVRSAP